MIVQNYLKNLSKHKFDIDIKQYLYTKEREIHKEPEKSVKT